MGKNANFYIVPPYCRIRVLMRIPSLYMACLPPGRYLVLDTIFSMSNAELRLKNEEVEIRNGIGITNFGEKCEFLHCTWYLVHCTYLFGSKENPVKTYSQSTSKRDPVVLFVFGCQQEIGTEGKIHGNLWCLHQSERSSNRRSNLK